MLSNCWKKIKQTLCFKKKKAKKTVSWNPHICEIKLVKPIKSETKKLGSKFDEKMYKSTLSQLGKFI